MLIINFTQEYHKYTKIIDHSVSCILSNAISFLKHLWMGSFSNIKLDVFYYPNEP